MVSEQPEALRLADGITHPEGEPTWETCVKAAAELRRLHDENFALAAQQCLYHDGSGLTGDESGTAVCMKDLELRRLHEEVQEQCRINGMGAERELKLMTEKQELLEALKAADWYIGQLEPFVYGADDDGVHEEHAKVRAAIAKAEGETK